MRMSSRYKQWLGVVLSVLTVQAWAAAGDTIPKDDWLGKLQEIAPTVLCDGFLEDEDGKKAMQAVGIDKAKCKTLIPPLYDRCRSRYYSSIPATIDSTKVSQWGTKIGECIATIFLVEKLGINAPSETATRSTTSSPNYPMTKEVWFSELKKAGPAMLCRAYLKEEILKVEMKKNNIDYEKCVGLIPASMDKCKSKFYDKLPNTITKELNSKWRYKIGQCVGADFDNLLASP